MPVFAAGMITCFAVEKFKIAGFGTQLPNEIKEIFENYSNYQQSNLTEQDKTNLLIESFVGILLIFALALHVAEVGIIGLGVIVLLTAFKGVNEEHDLGPAFNEALPFTGLLVVFCCIMLIAIAHIVRCSFEAEWIRINVLLPVWSKWRLDQLCVLNTE